MPVAAADSTAPVICQRLASPPETSSASYSQRLVRCRPLLRRPIDTREWLLHTRAQQRHGHGSQAARCWGLHHSTSPEAHPRTGRPAGVLSCPQAYVRKQAARPLPAPLSPHPAPGQARAAPASRSPSQSWSASCAAPAAPGGGGRQAPAPPPPSAAPSAKTYRKPHSRTRVTVKPGRSSERLTVLPRCSARPLAPPKPHREAQGPAGRALGRAIARGGSERFAASHGNHSAKGSGEPSGGLPQPCNQLRSA